MGRGEEKHRWKIKDAREILRKVQEDFENPHAGEGTVYAGCGSFGVDLTDAEGNTAVFSGTPPITVLSGGDLSEIIREALNKPDLFCFGGKTKEDRVRRIVLNSCRTVTGISPKGSGNSSAFWTITGFLRRGTA